MSTPAQAPKRAAGSVELLSPRDVPLGGPRAMSVRRTLPQRERSLIGPWCFVDHFGPDYVAETGGMQVPPHPHTGLQTVTWLFSGEIEHCDSIGNQQTVRPGELNLMTAGRGVSHSEMSTPQTTSLHGAQLWVALPDKFRHVDPSFLHHVPAPVYGKGWLARVFLGSVLGASSPVPTYTPMLGAELVLAAGSELGIGIDATFEHGVLIDTGRLTVNGVPSVPGELAFVSPGARRLELQTHETPVRLLLIGGPPFGESLVMWWNFVGRTHEEIVSFREEWQQQIADVEDAQLVRPGRFGTVAAEHATPIPAPAMPQVRLKQRP